MTAPEHGERPAEAAADEASGAAAAAGAAAAGVAQEPEQLRRQVAELQEELERARAQRTRAVADYQNLQRRSSEERQEQARLMMKALVLNFLPVLDDLGRALESLREHPQLPEHPAVEGVRLVQQKFRGVLEAGGVREIAAAGEAFDPQLHEAVAHRPGPEGRVVGLVRSGYVLDGLVVRPAVVLVGNGEPVAGGAANGPPAGREQAPDASPATDQREG